MTRLATVHDEHWMEPKAVSAERSQGELICESCGEDLPWHNASCAMLKNAYKRRLSKCHFCGEKHFVGGKMQAHVEANHQTELAALLTGNR
jgi:predicted amidophosphoribosyltransferase